MKQLASIPLVDVRQQRAVQRKLLIVGVVIVALLSVVIAIAARY
jgi:hypothetical protein